MMPRSETSGDGHRLFLQWHRGAFSWRRSYDLLQNGRVSACDSHLLELPRDAENRFFFVRRADQLHTNGQRSGSKTGTDTIGNPMNEKGCV